ncbi:MAG: hypothetical protein H0T42_03520 [Deltaproteobacteria bacterium]|nr:hypothetical protein [Deltaproteobacteria bacterium]
MAVTAIKRLSVASIEWGPPVPPPPVPVTPARPGVLATPLVSLPSPQELIESARAIAAETSFPAAALRLQHEICQLIRGSEALCVAFDWTYRVAFTATETIESTEITELVAHVAGTGRRTVIGNAVIAPIGVAPAWAVIAVRRAVPFRSPEIAVVTMLAERVAGPIGRFLR